MTASLLEAFRIARANGTTQTKLPYSGAILPRKPKIDEIAAFAILSMSSAEDLTFVQFHDRAICTEEEIEDWLARGVCPISVGERDYIRVKYHSATEWAFIHHALPRSPGMMLLVQMMNENNQTGFLKSYPFSVAGLMREFNDFENDGGWWIRVVQAASDVITAFVNVKNSGAVRDWTTMDAEVVEFARKFVASADQPLTIGQYIRNLWALGSTFEEVREKVAFWLDGMKRLEQERARANAEFKQTNREEFLLNGRRGLVLRTSDPFLTKAAVRSKQYAVIVIVGADGHVTILTKLPVHSLVGMLRRQEPGRWHYHKTGAIINGGVQHLGIQPTEILIPQLVSMIQQSLRLQVVKNKNK